MMPNSTPKFIQMPQQARLNELFDYDQKTGQLIWRHRGKNDFQDIRAYRIWTTKYSGTVAGSVDSAGYGSIRIDSFRYRSHRIVWVMHYGDIGEMNIDHINHNKLDNRIENLRLVTRSENHHNLSMSDNNTSGYTGVAWNKEKSKWRSYISIDGKPTHLGWFKNIDAAIQARLIANVKNGYHENHGKSL